MSAAAPGRAAAIAGPTRFHPRYPTKRAGDVILITADDRAHIGFYFRLSLLAELSNFFATLPPPASPEDLVNDIPLIPLHDIKHVGLILLLDAIQSIASPDPFEIHPELASPDVAEPILQATIAAKMYQIPVVHRVLLEAIHSITQARSRDYYFEFAISAIAGVEASLPHLARATLLPDQQHISEVPRVICEAAKSHALLPWCELLDLHARHTRAVYRVHKYLRGHSEFKKKRRSDLEHLNCNGRGPSRPGVAAEELYQRYLDATTVDEVIAVSGGLWGLTCPACREAAELRYRELAVWVQESAYGYPRKRRQLDVNAR